MGAVHFHVVSLERTDDSKHHRIQAPLGLLCRPILTIDNEHRGPAHVSRFEVLVHIDSFQGKVFSRTKTDISEKVIDTVVEEPNSAPSGRLVVWISRLLALQSRSEER